MVNKQYGTAAATNDIACEHVSEAHGADVCMNMSTNILLLAIVGFAHKSC